MKMKKLDQYIKENMKCVSRFWMWLALTLIAIEALTVASLFVTYHGKGDLGESYFKVGNHQFFVGYVYWPDSLFEEDDKEMEQGNGSK